MRQPHDNLPRVNLVLDYSGKARLIHQVYYGVLVGELSYIEAPPLLPPLSVQYLRCQIKAAQKSTYGLPLSDQIIRDDFDLLCWHHSYSNVRRLASMHP